jgi:RNA-directed DNA polymerase
MYRSTNGCSDAGYDQGSYSRRSCSAWRQEHPGAGLYRRGTANIALDGLEEILKQKFKGNKVNYTRYADDSVITGATKELLENEVKPEVVRFLAERGLALSEEKTVVTHIDDGFDFLGFNIKSYKGKVLTKPQKTGIASVLKKIKNIIKKIPQAKQENLIRLLSPVIRGWGNYYSHVVSKDVLTSIDSKIMLKLMKWASRRHPGNRTGG